MSRPAWPRAGRADPWKGCGSYSRSGIRSLFLVQVTLFRGIAGIGDGRRDHVSATGPFSKIGQAATLATKGKVRVRLFHPPLASRALNCELALAGHVGLEDARDQ